MVGKCTHVLMPSIVLDSRSICCVVLFLSGSSEVETCADRVQTSSKPLLSLYDTHSQCALPSRRHQALLLRTHDLREDRADRARGLGVGRLRNTAQSVGAGAGRRAQCALCCVLQGREGVALLVPGACAVFWSGASS